MTGRTEEGSSKVPTRTPVNCGLAEELANIWVPQIGQKRRWISLPLSAIETNSLNSPEILIAELGTIKLTEPLADIV